MNKDEVQDWIDKYQEIEKVIMAHVNESDPMAEWPVVVVQEGKVVFEYTTRVPTGIYSHYDDRHVTYTAEGLAAMFDRVRDME